jgi:hypothetical protein
MCVETETIPCLRRAPFLSWRLGGDVAEVVSGAGYDHIPMPDEEAVQGWIRRNEAARAEDRRRDLERSMSERLEEAVRLSRLASELASNLGRDPDVRAR